MRAGLALAIVLGAASAAAEPVALLATEPQGTETALYLVEPGGVLPAPAARFDHLPGASVQAAVVPGARVVVAVADRTPSRDLSFASALVKLAPGAEPVWLCDRVVVASRPLVHGGKALVARGRPGAAREGEQRIDELTVDEIDLDTGRARTLHAMRGHLLHLAGARGRDVFVYRVRPDGADVVAVGPSGTRVVIPSLPPYARDFSVDENGALVFQNLEDGRWRVRRAGAAEPLEVKDDVRRAPVAWPRGRVTLSSTRRVLAVSSDRRRAAALESRPGFFPLPLVVDETGAERPLPWPPGRRVTIAGFLP
jgi:hypothetical protein